MTKKAEQELEDIQRNYAHQVLEEQTTSQDTMVAKMTKQRIQALIAEQVRLGKIVEIKKALEHNSSFDNLYAHLLDRLKDLNYRGQSDEL